MPNQCAVEGAWPGAAISPKGSYGVMRLPKIAQKIQKRMTVAPMRKLGVRKRRRMRSRRAALASERVEGTANDVIPPPRSGCVG